MVLAALGLDAALVSIGSATFFRATVPVAVEAEAASSAAGLLAAGAALP